MKVEVKDADEYIKFFDGFDPVLSEECEMHFTPEHLKIEQWSPDHTSIVSAILGKEYFMVYEVEETVDIIVDWDDFLKKLKTFKSYGKLLTTVPDLLQLYSSKGRSRKKMKIPLLVDVNIDETPDINTLKYSFIGSMEAKDVLEAVKDARIINDEVYFEKKDDLFSIHARDENNSESIREWTIGDDIIQLVTGDGKAMFGCEPIKKMVTVGAKLSDRVQIGLRTDAPLQLRYAFPNGYITYIIAPQIVGYE